MKIELQLQHAPPLRAWLAIASLTPPGGTATVIQVRDAVVQLGAWQMAEINAEALVITDSEGNYYVLPSELVEVSRIEPEAKSRVDEYLRESDKSDSAADGFSYVGSISLPAESKWTHFSPSVAWPNGGVTSGRQHPAHMVMLDKPVISSE